MDSQPGWTASWTLLSVAQSIEIEPRVVVAQIGARHHYAIPRILEAAGILEAFYTDSNSAVGVGRVLRSIPIARRLSAVKRLIERFPAGVPAHKIRQTDRLCFRHLVSTYQSGNGEPAYVGDDLLFDRVVSRWGFGNGTVLYAMQKHGTRLLKRARRCGLRVAVDVFITPLAGRIVEAERKTYPELEPIVPGDNSRGREEARTAEELRYAELLICPGNNVVEGLRRFPGFSGKEYRVVPYGAGISFGPEFNAPERGRVLFAGTAELRKGIQYLAMAAGILRKRGRRYQFRVAGGVTDRIREHPLMKELKFLGRLPAADMRSEFLAADLMVLPTLAEGCASAVHESIIARCPVITTAASGTLVRDGAGGVVVEERNPVALADAIEAVVEDRGYRDSLAESCTRLAPELSEAAWGRRLVSAFRDLSRNDSEGKQNRKFNLINANHVDDGAKGPRQARH